MTALRVPRADPPLVSVVMVTYGGWPWPEKALSALVQHTDPVYEVVVVDNASPDGTGGRLRESVAGATVLLNERNEGFGPAANRGAAGASGSHLCFLNPDALVEAGWLPPLLASLEDPRVGAAAPRLLNLDGTLQEAGSAVGREGATWAIGQGEDADDLQHRFRRVVDYASAACLLVRRAAFEAVGGFDPAYRPAYYEDVDLCLSLRRRGSRTVYEPRSVVRHVRGASIEGSGAERLILANRLVLWRRWWRELAKRPWLEDVPLFPARAVAARDWECPDRILLVAGRVPDQETAERRLLLEVAALWPDARVTLVAEAPDAGERNAAPLLARGVEVALGPRDWERWFDHRRFHASAVVFLDGPERLAGLVRRWQPQAPVMEPGVLASVLAAGPGALRPALVEAMAALGVGPPERVEHLEAVG